MTYPFQSAEDYELFLYTITEKYPAILHSTITFVRKGSSLARVAGELAFKNGVRIVVRERILFDRHPIIIDGYGYEIWKDNEKLCWYDSQPHPNEKSLQSTHPHHKHIPPDIKHNRIPAPEMSFDYPNLPALIEEVKSL